MVLVRSIQAEFLTNNGICTVMCPSVRPCTDLVPRLCAAWDLLNEARCQKCPNGTIAVRPRFFQDMHEIGLCFCNVAEVCIHTALICSVK